MATPINSSSTTSSFPALNYPLPSLEHLPTELHIQIASSLSYPDALALKHTNRHFYGLVKTDILLKVAWLLERKRLHLEWPAQTCDFKSDETFCVDGVRKLMKRRREHKECSFGNNGCKVVVGTLCVRKKQNTAEKLRYAFKTWRKGVLESLPVGVLENMIYSSFIILLFAVAAFFWSQ